MRYQGPKYQCSVNDEGSNIHSKFKTVRVSRDGDLDEKKRSSSVKREETTKYAFEKGKRHFKQKKDFFANRVRPLLPRYLREDNPLPEDSANWQSPWAQMRTYSFNPCVFPAMVGAVSPDAKAGDWVKVYDRDGNPFGAALYNPKAKVPLRVFAHGDVEPNDEIIFQGLERAITLRHDILHLPEFTNAYRVVNSDGDGLGGLIVDRYADVLKYNTVKIQENGVKFEVDFSKGHKTGFFCDQRENRLRFSKLVKGKRVLDLCCYTGGFSVMASLLGEAAEVTGVDLDEFAIQQAKRHANINGQRRINWVHADAFSYARQMKLNNEKWDVVLLDPPKLIENREDEFEGMGKYEDLNKLGMSLLNPAGILVSCSCSGLLSLNRFEDILIKAAHRNNRRLQFFNCTGPGEDHPIYSNCLESRYLKVLWARVI